MFICTWKDKILSSLKAGAKYGNALHPITVSKGVKNSLYHFTSAS